MLPTSPLKTRSQRRWRRVIVALATLVVVAVIGELVLGQVFRARLAAAVKHGMNADLSVGLAWYLPPRGVSLHHVRITQLQPDGKRLELFSASRVVLKLKEFQKPGRPLIVSWLQVDTPSVAIVSHQAKAAAAPEPAIASSKAAPARTAAAPTASSPKPASPFPAAASPTSAQLEILGLKITDGQISFGSPAPDTVAIEHINLAFSPAPGSTEVYPFPGDANIQLASGKASLAGSSTTIDSINADIHIENDAATSALRITLGKFLATSGASQLNIDGGRFSMIPDHQAWELAELRGRLDLAGDVPALEKSHLKGRFMFCGGASGPMQLPRDASFLSVVHHELIVYPRDASIQPPKYPIPVDHINGGPIAFRGGVIRFENLCANYGSDRVLLDEAHITLDDPRQKIEIQDLRRQIRVEGIAGTLVCKQPGPAYPAGLGKTIAQLRPSGAFAIGGGSWYAVNRKLPQATDKPKPDYFFHVSTAGGAFALTEHKAPLTDIHADATVSPMLVDIPELRGNMLGGTVIASTKITPIRPVSYDGTATFYNVNLQTASRDLGLQLQKPLIGHMYLKTHARGQGPGGPRSPLESFAAEGEFQIVDGNFGDIPTVRVAAAKVTKADQELDGEAAGLFTIKNERVALDNAAVGNSLFGLQGTGAIGFDKSLDLHACAAPLGDWQTNLKRSNVPILEDVGSDIAGAIQQLFSGAQQTLLWDIHITGTTTAPKVEQVPAPVITRSVAAIFGQLIRGGKDDELINQMRPKK